MSESWLLKAIVNGLSAGAARQPLSNMLSFAETVSDVPSGVQVGFGFVAAEEPSPASTSQDIAATAGRNMAVTTVKRTLIRSSRFPD